MEPALILALLAMGCAMGFSAGLLGIGGGMLLVPLMTFLLTAKKFPSELIVHMAIATSMATIMFTSLSSLRAHHKLGAVQWRIGRCAGAGHPAWFLRRCMDRCAIASGAVWHCFLPCLSHCQQRNALE